MATHSCSCLENPRDRGAWWAAVYGVAQSWTWLKPLSSKITADSDCSHEIKKHFLLGRKAMTHLLLLLSRFSHVQLCATPQTAAHQAATVPGILQARTLEWVVISFSNAGKWKVKVKSLSCVRLLATPWTAAHQTPPSMVFFSKNTGVGCHCLLQMLHMPVVNYILKTVRNTVN